MRILITGSNGFVGTETINLLIKEGHEIVHYDLMGGGDIRDFRQFENTLKEFKPIRILHLAAVARFSDADKDPLLAYETNVMGTRSEEHTS